MSTTDVRDPEPSRGAWARARRALQLLPFSAAAVYLVLAGATGDDLLGDAVLLAGIAAVVVGFVALLGSLVPSGRGLWRVPCLLAPVAVALPWAVTPSRIGLGFGGLPLFLGWLTRHPTLGPVNGPVLAGLGCVLGASAMPVLHALVASRGRAVAVGTFALALVPYGAVLVFLDVELVITAALYFPPFVTGPILRALAVLGMLVGTLGVLTRR